MKNIAMLISLFIATVANAAPPILIDQKTGKYLGNLSTNQNDPDSVKRYFVACGSYLRRDGRVLLNSLSKVYKVFVPNE